MNKKYFFLLATLFCIMGGVNAQTLSDAITDASNLTNDGLYTIESAGRGHLLYNTTYPDNISSTSTSGITNTNPTGETNELFCIIHTSGMTAGQYYLYSVGAGKFAGYSGTSGVLDFVTYEEPNANCIVTLTAGSNGNGTGFVFKFPNAGTDYRINVTNPTNGAKAYGVKIFNNTDVDDGSIMVIKQCTGVTHDGYAAMMQKVYNVDGTKTNYLDYADVTGYPTSTSSAYTTLKEHYDAGTITSDDISAFTTSGEITMPEDGKAYKIVAVHPNGKEQLLYYTGSAVGAKIESNISDIYDAYWVCHKTSETENKYLFVNHNGFYLNWFCNEASKGLNATGVSTSYNADYNVWTLSRAITTGGASGSSIDSGTTNATLYGRFQLNAKGAGSNYYYLIARYNGDSSAGTFHAGPANAKYYMASNNNTFTYKLVEVDYYNKLKFQTPVTTDGNDYASIYLPYAATVPTGATAYIGALNSENSKLTLTEITDGIIPKETAVVMSAPTESALGTVYVAPATQAGTTVTSGNILKGTVNADDHPRNVLIYTYVLNGGYGEIGFYKYTADNLPLGRAYFEVATDVPTSGTGAGVQGFLFDFGEEEGETTGINAAALSNSNAAKTYYDLSGRRVANPKNGLYICNGKKVYIK